MCETPELQPHEELVLTPSPISASQYSSAEVYSERGVLLYPLSTSHEHALSNSSHSGMVEARTRAREDTSGPEGGISKTSRTKPKHVCKECGKTFKRAHNLKIHGRLHSGVRPYQCPFKGCGKDFRWKSSIVSHINWHRSKMGEELPENVSVHKLKKSDVANAGFDVDAVREVKDDATVVTEGCGSFQASPAAMGVAELDCYNVLDVKEWDTRPDGGRIGGGLMPSLSCCRMENEGFGTFLD